MGKDKKEKRKADPTSVEAEVDAMQGVETDYVIGALVPIAKPLATEKLMKKLIKTVKKASKQKHVKRGVREVVKGLRKKEKGLVVIAGDISPLDVISHLPVLCEENNVPYVFVRSKAELGLAAATKRPTSCLMIVPGGGLKKKEAWEEYKESYEEVHDKVKEMNHAQLV
jgi:H/ACA ribonucleoprotein complex subunit 2